MSLLPWDDIFPDLLTTDIIVEQQQPKHPKFASSIAQLADAASALPLGAPMTDETVALAGDAVAALVEAGVLRLDDQGRVQVYIHVLSAELYILDELEVMGILVERWSDSGTIIQAWVPVKALPALAEQEFVLAVTPPNYGHLNVGSTQTEGDSLLGFDGLRTSLGVTGAGVTVGVISDGIAGLANAVAAGDLPAGVIATSFRSNGDLEAGAEGTAILEIIHDIAPGALLRFANFSTGLEFIAAVDYLASNSDVVIDDISFVGAPYDQTSDVSTNTAEELNRATNPIRGYYTSVGNQALSHYEEPFVVDSVCIGDGSTCQRFDATADTTDALGIGPSDSNRVLVADGGTVVVWLTWSDTFGAATSDYDLYLVDTATSVLVAFGVTDNIDVTGDPVEVAVATNISGGALYLDIEVTNYQGTQPTHTLELFVFGGVDLGNGTDLNFNTLRSSVPAQSDAGGGVVSVGAISASDPGVDDIEPFSSRGPTNNGVIKPDVVAIDGVSVTASGGFFSPFFGTSAAAPHVAGLAALLLEVRPDLLTGALGENPTAARAALRAAIADTAFDLGDTGTDNTYGAGRVRGSVAGQFLVDSTPEAIPSLTAWGLVAMATLLGLFLAIRGSWLGRRVLSR